MAESSFKFDVDSKFSDVNSLLKGAYEIFLDEVHHLDGKMASTNLGSVTHGDVTEQQQHQKQEKQQLQAKETARDIATGSSDISDSFVPFVGTFGGNTYDVYNFNINVAVHSSGDTFLTLGTDESYNLTLSCKYSPPLISILFSGVLKLEI